MLLLGFARRTNKRGRFVIHQRFIFFVDTTVFQPVMYTHFSRRQIAGWESARVIKWFQRNGLFNFAG